VITARPHLTVLLSLVLACFGLAANVEASHSHSHSHSHPHSHSHSHGEHHTGSSSHQEHHFLGAFHHTSHRLVNSNAAPGAATAECNDGTYSFDTSHQDACLNHGGVKRWLR
jgi:hypothetical protein